MLLALALLHQNTRAQDLPLIRRTQYGIPHILADDFHGIGVGLGYAQVEDYGARVVLRLVRARGELGRAFGRDSMESDFRARLTHRRAVETFHLLDADTRSMLEGFAEGVNIYLRTHPDEFGAWARPNFTGHDVAALDIGSANLGAAQRVVQRELERGGITESGGTLSRDPRSEILDPRSEEGSNAWAFAPSRTKSGRAILLRNPHLSWAAGYWEAHVTIPGVLNFYGDFRIGGPFGVIGGFNQHLGWSTTNNAPDTDEVYALDLHPWYPNHYWFDGAVVPMRREDVIVDYKTDAGAAHETRTFWFTPLGPVVHRTKDRIYVVRFGSEGEHRSGQQFIRMMRARSLAEWKAAMAMRARSTSNFTYADRAGNIFYLWNASVPRRPHGYRADSASVPARRTAELWTELVPFDSLPQLLNPKGGYLHNENDAPYYANLNAILDTLKYPSYIERPRLGLRSQHALQLIHNHRKLSLEDVIRLKHSMRMLLADRVKSDLLAALKSAGDTTLNAAAMTLGRWDNTVAPESRGGVLFEAWWRRYQSQARDSAFAQRWRADQLTSTPSGLGRPDLAADAMRWAIGEVQRRHGSLDVAWGVVHRVRRGAIDVPVGGCAGALGCFRVLSYEDQTDGKRAANSGDGWILAVEFTDVPRAYSVLAYGQSADPASPHYADQAEMFARGELKRVAFTEADILRTLLRQYRPGVR